MSTTQDIRTAFLDFFADRDHQVVPSAPLVPRNDPTLMFTNAGMVPFKNIFTGQEAAFHPRAASSQKCVRAGGKHNDLDNVGYTARHHTFFEMLGNFSFGDYFKEQAIVNAWDLVTGTFGLPKDKLLVTVHSTDEEAAGLWKKVTGISDDKVIRIPTSDNFWSMGDTGPCGPCSEIFFDHGEAIPGGPPGSPDEDGDRFIEIWNLVFMQFEQVTVDERRNLPKPSIDTGMGLERIAAVIQGKHDNYDIDLMRALIEAVASAAGTDPDGPLKASHRVIADHLRAMSFLIADGVLPSNEGRGYVLRRIMRRAMRHAHMMGVRDLLLYRLVPSLVAEMGSHFGELGRAQALITETLKLEEERFRQMLDRGMKLLDDELDALGSGKVLAGETAFKLYDTYGFPLDLTQDALREKGLAVDVPGFEAAMAAQKAEARKAWKGSGEAATEDVWFDVCEPLAPTDFLGYATDTAQGVVTALVVDGKPVKTAAEGSQIALLANQTPFYGESGGQIGDTGTIVTAGGAEITVTDTQKKLGAHHVHIGTVRKGSVAVGDEVTFTIDAVRRADIRAHHSATHLLHAALRQVLGEHVTQKGSLVAEDRLRFDISHPKPITAEELARIEDIVNGQIRGNEAVTNKIMDQKAAIEAGAMALFGEKYGDEVRVISMGGVAQGAVNPFSVELCGGTHVSRTGDIGLFRIVSDSALASGVRRIEAVAGRAAEAYSRAQGAALTEAAAVLKTSPAQLVERLSALLDDRRKLERDVEALQKKLVTAQAGGGSGGGSDAKTVAGVNFLGRVLEDVPAKALKGMADEMKTQLGSGVVALISTDGGKASLVVAVTDDLTGTNNAVDYVRAGSEAVGGKGGGGRPDMAQAGGPDAGKAQDALAAIEAAIQSANG